MSVSIFPPAPAWRGKRFRLWAVAGALWLIGVAPAYAQFGGSCGCPVIVNDPQMYTRQGEQLQQESLTAQLLQQNTTGGGAGAWQSDQPFLNSLATAMSQGGGICYASGNAVQEFNADFPGMTPPPVNAAARARQLTAATLGTLVGALAVGQQQAVHFNFENGQFSALEAKNQNAQGALQAIQVTNEILLAQAQQLQMMRQLLITLINAESVYHGDRLNAEAQVAAQSGEFLSSGGTTGP
jgi:P-type conjugative transfer protein TrbJ